MDNDPGAIAEIANRGGDVCLLGKRTKSGGRELKAGWCANLRSSFEPDEEFQPCNARAVRGSGGVRNRVPEYVELVKEVFV